MVEVEGLGAGVGGRGSGVGGGSWFRVVGLTKRDSVSGQRKTVRWSFQSHVMNSDAELKMAISRDCFRGIDLSSNASRALPEYNPACHKHILVECFLLI